MALKQFLRKTKDTIENDARSNISSLFFLSNTKYRLKTQFVWRIERWLKLNNASSRMWNKRAKRFVLSCLLLLGIQKKKMGFYFFPFRLLPLFRFKIIIKLDRIEMCFCFRINGINKKKKQESRLSFIRDKNCCPD